MASTPGNGINISTTGVVYFNSSVFQSIAPGVTGTVLTSTGATAPTWQNVPSGTVMGPFGSIPNANGGTITGGVLTLEPAGTGFPGGLSSGTQSISGVKTFNATPIFPALTGVVTSDGASGLTGSTFAQNDILGAGASNSVVGISPSTANFVLTSNGPSSIPSFQAASTGTVTIAGDTGTITGSSLTIKSGVSTQNCGATVQFTNTGTTSTLNVTDSNVNTLIGLNSGNSVTNGGGNNGLGARTLQSMGFSCSANQAIGHGALYQLTAGSGNIAIGDSAGSAFNTNSNNIIIGTSNIGTNSDNNTLRIGLSTGSGSGQLNKSFISGINGNTSANPMMVTINSTTDQLGVAAIPSGEVIINGDTGSITGTTLTIKAAVSTFNCGSSVQFVNSGTTSVLSVTDSSLNTVLGHGSGNAAMGGGNTGFGSTVLSSINSSAGGNVGVGAQALFQLNSGSYNIGIGNASGSSYTTSESNNIVIGYSNQGIAGESNTLRIGNASGVEAGNLNKAFICGIIDNSFSPAQMVIIEPTTNQLGAAAIPSVSINIQYFTTPGSHTYTPTAGMKYCIVECIGGGGAGGGGGDSDTTGGGGGSGGYCSALFSAVTIGASQTLVVGGVTPGTGTTGATGAFSEFGASTLLQSAGGEGGESIGSVSPGGLGGITTAGDRKITGGPGSPGFILSGGGLISGAGGSGPFGTGGISVISGAGQPGNNYGGGGSGGAGAATLGGNGAQGIIIITEFIS